MIKKFISYLKDIKGYSANTCLAYEKDLHHFVRWIKTNHPTKTWSTITRDDIDLYLKDMVAEGLKPRTTNRHLASVSGIYKFFQREGYKVENPCRYESRRKPSASLPNTIPNEDLKAAYNGSSGVCKVMLGLLISTGMRIQELLDLKWENIDFKEGRIIVDGKGSKQRIVYSDKLDVLNECYSMGYRKGRVFTIDQRTARYMIYQALRQYSHAVQLSPHAIRHTFATNMAKQGANVVTIAKVLGHDDISTTQKYVDASQLNCKPIFQQYSIFNA